MSEPKDLDLRVKSEFVLSERPACLAPPPPPAPPSSGCGDGASSSQQNGGGSKRSKKNRGQNKKRPRDARAAVGDKACLAVVRGEPCPFANTPRGCKYNHDLKEMLANRPDDIKEVEGGCPIWNMKG